MLTKLWHHNDVLSQEKAVKVSNVVNDLQMLATNQFVENRVYDEPEEAIVVPFSPSNPRESEQQDALSKLKLSLCQGMDFVRRTLPPYDVDEDSDEEENIRHSVKSSLSQNRFLCRKLPPLIGGPEFVRENFVSLFRSQTRSSDEDVIDASDAIDAFTQSDGDQNDDRERNSEPEIEISSSDSDDMFLPPQNQIPSILANEGPVSGRLFSDASSPEDDDIFAPKHQPPAPKPTSFTDELNRRLLGNKTDSSVTAGPSTLTDSGASSTQTKKPVISEILSGSRPESTGSTDVSLPDRRRSGLLVHGDQRADPVPKPPPARKIEQQAVVAKAGSSSTGVKSVAPAPRNVLDFLSDDDDDDFNIFKNKLTTKGRASEKVSKLFESDDSDDGMEGRDEKERKQGKGLSAKDSDSRPEPKKEVSDALHSETRHAVQSVTSAKHSLKPTTSLFSPGEQSSDDEIFATRTVVHLPSAQRTSINSSSKSQVEQPDIPSVSVLPNPPDTSLPSDSSDSSSEEMKRSTIANKLETSIFGNKTRKPVGGISLFGSPAPSKQATAPEREGEDVVKDKPPTSVQKTPLPKAGVDENTTPLTKLNDTTEKDDLFPGTKSVTLSSQAIKSRPKVRNRRRPTRAALKSSTCTPAPSGSADEPEKSPLSTEATSRVLDLESVVANDSVKRTPEARKAGSVKSDAEEKSSWTGKETTEQIPHSHQLKAEKNLINDPDSVQVKKEISTVVPDTTTKKSIFSDDSDEDLFPKSRRQNSSKSTTPVTATVTRTAAAATTKSEAKKKALFSDSDDDDMFLAAKQTSSSLVTPVKSDQSLTETSSGKKSAVKAETGAPVTVVPPLNPEKLEAKAVPTTSKSKKETSRLFSDDSDDDDG